MYAILYDILLYLISFIFVIAGRHELRTGLQVILVTTVLNWTYRHYDMEESISAVASPAGSDRDGWLRQDMDL